MDVMRGVLRARKVSSDNLDLRAQAVESACARQIAGYAYDPNFVTHGLSVTPER